MATALQSALSWDDQATISVSIVCAAEGCDFEIELAERNSIETARAHLRTHHIEQARRR